MHIAIRVQQKRSPAIPSGAEVGLRKLVAPTLPLFRARRKEAVSDQRVELIRVRAKSFELAVKQQSRRRWTGGSALSPPPCRAANNGNGRAVEPGKGG